MTSTPLHPVPLEQVKLTGGYWAARQEANHTHTIPAVHRHSLITGRIDAIKQEWREGQPNKPHIFWDSDVAKWIEAVAYDLTINPDPEREAQVDAVIALYAQAQHADGYLNSYFMGVEPTKRWSNLRDWHELYCAGHLMEAAVAYHRATGKRELLDILRRYADYIFTVFGEGSGQMRGYSGHEEIELGLVKLYRETGETHYLDLAQFFVDERGQQPHYFDIEAEARGERLDSFHQYYRGNHAYQQSHAPVREQTEAVGHAVRACYLYAGMADIAQETGDIHLTAACKRLWDSITQRQMYVTGGIGSFRWNEGFSNDYDLPNEAAYAETCAAIALVFFAQRMFHLEPDSCYIDIMERALYNGIMSGVSLRGSHFFYANPLAAHPGFDPYTPDKLRDADFHFRRSAWFECSCCPPNLARLVASLGEYIYSQSDDQLYTHLYTTSETEVMLNDTSVYVAQQTEYPWRGTVNMVVHPERPVTFALALRIPGWVHGASLTINGQPHALENMIVRGYAVIRRLWQPGDQVVLHLPMPVERIAAHPHVRQNAGCIALQRGPLVYCIEEVDNGPLLAQLVLPRDAPLTATFEPHTLEGVMVISGEARRYGNDWSGGLYEAQRNEPQWEAVTLRAVPYSTWANRAPGEMRVWIRES